MNFETYSVNNKNTFEQNNLFSHDEKILIQLRRDHLHEEEKEIENSCQELTQLLQKLHFRTNFNKFGFRETFHFTQVLLALVQYFPKEKLKKIFT